MTWLFLVALVAGSTAQADDSGAGWTERYFGVGSAGASDSACTQARDHAQGNASDACTVRRGKRGPSDYTGCVCARTTEGVHVCNVHLKVLCDGSLASTSRPGGQHRGGPKGRVDRRREAPGGGTGASRGDRPGSRASTERERWTGASR